MIPIPKFLSDLWFGKYSLGRAFWGYFISGSILVIIASMMVFLMPLYLIRVPTGGGFGLAMAVIFLYMIIAAVGCWRSADNYKGKRLWAYGAKAVIVIWAIRNLLWLSNGGAAYYIARIASSN